MPQRKPYRRIDKYWNEKQLLADLVSSGNDIAGRGFFAPMLGSLGDLAGLGENGLRALVGKPQVEPWGGSEHIGRKMQTAGLVSSERRPKTELLASLVSPGAVLKTALNAPKTAVQALKAISRLDDMSLPMPRAKQGQLGAIDVWHGSPHKFDTFKAMDNIGGGEGAQAYGHGGYHASNPEVANSYAKTVVPPDIERIKYRLDLAKQKGNDEHVTHFQKLLNEAQFEPNLYRNQLRWPDPAREAADPLSDKHFLDWDKPLSEQDASVQALLPDFSGLDRPVTSLQGRIRLPDGSFADSEQQLSRALSARGIPGIRYLDGGSRSAGQGSHNYVTFDDALVNILERNGQPVTAPQPGLLGKMVAPQDELAQSMAKARQMLDDGTPVAVKDAWYATLTPEMRFRMAAESGIATPEERAAAMGFDTDAYHGTGSNNIESFDNSKGQTGSDKNLTGIPWFSSAPEVATKFAGYQIGDGFKYAPGNSTVYPVKLRMDGADIDKDGYYAKRGGVSEAKAIADGIPAIKWPESWYDLPDTKHGAIDRHGNLFGPDVPYPDQYGIVDKSRIRSRFAAFDPLRRDSSDIMAGLAPLGLGALLYGNGQIE